MKKTVRSDRNAAMVSLYYLNVSCKLISCSFHVDHSFFRKIPLTDLCEIWYSGEVFWRHRPLQSFSFLHENWFRHWIWERKSRRLAELQESYRYPSLKQNAREKLLSAFILLRSLGFFLFTYSFLIILYLLEAWFPSRMARIFCLFTSRPSPLKYRFEHE